jgi:hypothetical protein
MREYALANSLFWALAEGHACEQSARRNAMDVSKVQMCFAWFFEPRLPIKDKLTGSPRMPPRTPEI